MVSKYLTAGSIVILLAVCGWQYYDSRQLAQENARLKVLVVESDKYISALKNNIALNEQLAIQRNSFESFIREYSNASHAALQKLIRSDKQVTDWSNARIPASLLQLHKDSAAARNGTSTNPDSPAGTNPVP